MTEPALISKKLSSLVWKTLLVLAVAVPVVTVVFIWYQNNLEMPMPLSVRDSVLTNPLVFSIFIGLAVVSFATQYVFGSPERRKLQIRQRTLILVFLGPVVILIISVLAWWQSNDSVVSVLSEVAQKPLMLGSVAGLTAGSFILAFAVSTRDEQKRCLDVLVTLASVLLMFGGPTYLFYALQAVEVPYALAALIGLASFVAGIAIFLRFVPKETQA